LQKIQIQINLYFVYF